MFGSVLTYFIAALQVLFPPYLAYRLWRINFRTSGAWLLEAGFTVATLATLFVIFRWDVVGLPLRYVVCGGALVASLLSGVRVYDHPLSTDDGIRWRWGTVVEGAILGGLLLWAWAGFSPAQSAVEIAPPLRGSSYYVVHGGGTPPINYHGAFTEAQRYALDINQLNGWGARARGIYPSDPNHYAVFGDPVHSPLSGTIVQVVDSLPDQPPPESRPDRPAGNHIWLRHDSLHVVLAHLKHNSTRVTTGQQVTVGQSLAQVGNTGNTSEPHLHVHAVTAPGERPLDSDSLLSDGTPVPLTIEGRFLIRNRTFSAELPSSTQ